MTLRPIRVCLFTTIFLSVNASAVIVFVDIDDVVIDGVFQAVSVEFGSAESESRAVEWSTFQASDPPTVSERSVHFYWSDNVITVEAESSGFTGLYWRSSDYPGFGALELARLETGDAFGSEFANNLRLLGFSGYSGDWNYDPSSGYIGVRFYEGDASNLHYGWIQANYFNNAFTIEAIAFESEGMLISAGAIPEPNSTALVAGLVVLLLHKLNRRRAACSLTEPR